MSSNYTNDDLYSQIAFFEKISLFSGCILKSFDQKYLQNVKYNVKRSCTFHLILVGYLPTVT